MKKTPTLSYLIPAYNAEAFIENCLNSILEINLSKEIIIVNDGSTDKTGEIIDRYAGQYEFIHAYHQANAGESAARNTALAHATGKWIQHVDADDIVINDTNDFNAIFELAEQKQADVIKGLYLFSKEGQQNAITQPVFDAVKEHKAVTTSGRNFLDKCIGETFLFKHYRHRSALCVLLLPNTTRLRIQPKQNRLGLKNYPLTSQATRKIPCSCGQIRHTKLTLYPLYPFRISAYSHTRLQHATQSRLPQRKSRCRTV